MTSFDILLIKVIDSQAQYDQLQRDHNRFMLARHKTPLDVRELNGDQQLEPKYQYIATCPGCRGWKVTWNSAAGPSDVCWVPFCEHCQSYNRMSARRLSLFDLIST